MWTIQISESISSILRPVCLLRPKTHVKSEAQKDPFGSTCACSLSPDLPRIDHYVSWKEINPMSRMLIDFGCMKMTAQSHNRERKSLREEQFDQLENTKKYRKLIIKLVGFANNGNHSCTFLRNFQKLCFEQKSLYYCTLW